LVAYGSNALLNSFVDRSWAWRWMLGVEAIPAFIYTLMAMMLPESPRWLIQQGDIDGGKTVIRNASPEMDEDWVVQQVDEIVAGAKADSAGASESFFSSRLRTPIQLAFCMAFFNQASGINAILYFAPRIFKAAGLGEEAALLQSIGIGFANLIATLTGVALIDKLGRRSLMYIGSFGYIISLSMTSWAYHTETFSIVPACIFAFIFAHAVGQGACIWVFISEIFPSRHRGSGAALGSFTHWFFAAFLTLIFPTMKDQLPASVVFGIFNFFCILQLFWVIFAMPETKGRTLEQVQIELGLTVPGIKAEEAVDLNG